MATQPVLRLAILVMSLPYILVAKVVELIKIKGLEADLHRCIVIVDNHEVTVPMVFIQAVIVAEDHRSQLHAGIDPLAILRAIAVRFLWGRVQGASTIEQQFVRVVTGRYERTISRKFREQILALHLARRKSKLSIASAYLSIACFGTEHTGLEGLRKRFGQGLAQVEFESALGFVSQLKYPRPQLPTVVWHTKVLRRANYLIKRSGRAANNYVVEGTLLCNAPLNTNVSQTTLFENLAENQSSRAYQKSRLPDSSLCVRRGLGQGGCPLRFPASGRWR